MRDPKRKIQITTKKMVHKIKNEKEFNEFIKKPAVIIDFWATWCMPCQMMGQILEKIAPEFKNVEIAKVNVDENQELAEKFDIMSIPTLLFYKKGKLVDRTSEALGEEEVREKIKNNFR